MCWNIEFSLASAVLGWAACLYLWQRGYSVRDRWYAKYLSTFTLTQLVDIFFWWAHEHSQQQLGPGRGGLRACPELKEQFSMRLPPLESGQQPQYLVSKFLIPAIVLVQFCNQLSYPGCRDFFAERMRAAGVPGTPYWVLIAAHALASVGMSFAFGCTDIQKSLFPREHDSLRWGGHSAETWEVLIVVAVVCADFCVTMRELSVRLAHCVVFLGVVLTLWITEGSLAVGSKWCTYCLIFSLVYVSDPLWGPGPGGKAPGRAGGAAAAGEGGMTAAAKASGGGGGWLGPSWLIVAALALIPALALASPAATLATQALSTLSQ
mmetsp:Transcript_49004/g.129993  ORF Transcript_49004/g.129993 Transcript_49004/m.129993 type:complete len:321 (-) Transcript_49004:143-1105(-)